VFKEFPRHATKPLSDSGRLFPLERCELARRSQRRKKADSREAGAEALSKSNAKGNNCKYSPTGEVWKDFFDWKECRNYKYRKQKIDYMHANPCRGKWNLADDITVYMHSSARFYLTGEHAVYPVTSYLELDDIDLTTSR
jgi:hypothetical protein